MVSNKYKKEIEVEQKMDKGGEKWRKKGAETELHIKVRKQKAVEKEKNGRSTFREGGSG